MTPSGENDSVEAMRARALDLVPEMAPVLGISTSELRRRVSLADETKLRAALDAYDEQQRWLGELSNLDTSNSKERQHGADRT